jgi:hypothetical protein
LGADAEEAEMTPEWDQGFGKAMEENKVLTLEGASRKLLVAQP